MIKVAIIGPESTGKTTLAMALSEVYKATYVPEYARRFLTDLSGDYQFDHLLDIAKGQLAAEIECIKESPSMLFADTEMAVMKVWSEFKYGRCDPWILQQLDRQDYDLYLLTYFDIPYEDDPLRENPNQRESLFDIYQQLIIEKEWPFVIVKGDHDERMKLAMKRIDALM